MDYPEDLVDPDLLPFTIAIGALCISWANLEGGIRMLFLKVSEMPIDRDSFGIAHCLDVRNQMSAIKVAFVGKSTDPRLPEAAISILDYIDNTLRPHRNRYVHDRWTYCSDVEAVNRFDYRPRTYRPQSRKPLEWTFAIESGELPKVWDAVRDIDDHARAVFDLQRCFNREEGALERLLEEPLQRRLAPRQPEKQRQKPRAKPKPQRPPESSPA